MSTVAELRAELEGLRVKARGITDAVDREGRQFTEAEHGQIAVILAEGQAIKDQIQQAEQQVLQAQASLDLRGNLNSLWDGIDSQGGTRTSAPTPLIVPQNGQRKSAGDLFVNSQEYREFMATYAPSGYIPETTKGIRSRPVFFNDLITAASATSGGALIVPDQTGIVIDPLRRPLTMREIITNGTTNSNSVEFVRVTSETNAADFVPEATATAGSSGVKPQSTMALERVTATVKTIAHWMAITKAALSDAGQLRTMIDNFLRYGLDQVLDNEILNGNGGDGFTGILETANVQTQAWDTNILTTTRKARTLVRTVGRDTPNAYVLNPADWQTIDLLQDNEARYFFGGPAQMGTPRLWGLPVIESEAIAEGVGLVGNFRQAVYWSREEDSITVSDSHADFFIRNLVAVLAEKRGAFGVLRPRSFVEMDLAA